MRNGLVVDLDGNADIGQGLRTLGGSGADCLCLLVHGAEHMHSRNTGNHQQP
jgi:hypothetical protein